MIKKTIICIGVFISLFFNSWAHNGGFLERCDKIPLPNCTFSWTDVTSTDSALYLVGNAGNCFIYYHKGGVKSPTTGTTMDLTGVQFINNSVGYVWGAGGTLLKTIDGGIDWTPISTNTSSAINQVQFIDENIGFIMFDTIISKTVNGGSTWTSVTLPAAISFKDFYFFDSLNGQICGQKTTPSLSGYLFKTTDGGVSWNQIYTDTCAFSKLIYTDNNKGYLYGTTSLDPLLFETGNAGNNWAIQYTSPSWSLGSDIVSFTGQTLFVTNEISGSFLYNMPYFLNVAEGVLFNPINIYSTTLNGDEILYIVAASGLYRYFAGNSICKQITFATNIIADTANSYNVLASGKKLDLKLFYTM